ncbi:hypothetical protein FACS1894188_04520 [Clostridia bacterium]|nr:hypothetical protein FACS1894188_04520 [Clostridia bacterium]
MLCMEYDATEERLAWEERLAEERAEAAEKAATKARAEERAEAEKAAAEAKKARANERRTALQNLATSGISMEIIKRSYPNITDSETKYVLELQSKVIKGFS